METATEVMNLVAAILILITGIYAQIFLTPVIPMSMRALIGFVAGAYFLSRVVKLLKSNQDR